MPGQMMIDPQTLLTRIGEPDAPVMIDVCIDEDFALDPRLIPGAIRHPFLQVEALAPDLVGYDVIVICQKGLKLSQGAAALLRSHGINAKALQGGMVEWAARGYPAIPASAARCARTVAAEDPHPEVLSVLWLVKRFVDRNAQILFVDPDAAPAAADRFDATLAPTWAKAVNDWTLQTPALNRMNDAMNSGAPEAAGILAVLDGLRALNPDDLSYFAASLPLFDALHRTCLDGGEDGIGAAA